MEAGLGEDVALDDYLASGKGDARSALRSSVYRIWYTEELLAMVEWMRAWNADPAHTTKLRFYGIDVQSPPAALYNVLAYLDRVDPATTARARDQLAPLRKDLSRRDHARLPAATRAALHDGITALLARFDAERACPHASTGCSSSTGPAPHARFRDRAMR